MWIDYVRNFIRKNDQFADELYGRWIDILDKIQLESRDGNAPTSPSKHPPKEASSRVDPEKNKEPRKPEMPEPSEDPNKAKESVVPKIMVLEDLEKTGHETDMEVDEQEKGPPTKKDFNVPENDEEYDEMVEGMLKLGMRLTDAETNLKLRNTLLTRATNAYEKERNKKTRQAQVKTRKNSR